MLIERLFNLQHDATLFPLKYAGCHVDDQTSVLVKCTSRAQSRSSQPMGFHWDWWCWYAAECALLPEGFSSKMHFWRTTPAACIASAHV